MAVDPAGQIAKIDPTRLSKIPTLISDHTGSALGANQPIFGRFQRAATDPLY